MRDALLGRPVADLDLALPAGSVAAARRLADRLDGAFVPLGEAHGTARVVLRQPIAAVLDLTDFRGPSLEADLRGRDVTIDALAVPVEALVRGPAAVVDPTGGLADLAARRLRACSPTAFADDAVRVLRVLRLAAELGFAIEAETEQLARSAVPGLAAVSVERVRDELTRIWRCAGQRTGGPPGGRVGRGRRRSCPRAAHADGDAVGAPPLLGVGALAAGAGGARDAARRR